MKTEIRKDEDTVGSRCKLGALSKGHEGARGSTGGAPGEEKCFFVVGYALVGCRRGGLINLDGNECERTQRNRRLIY